MCLCPFFFSTSDPSTRKAVLNTRKQLSTTILDSAFHKHKSLLILNYTKLASFFNDSIKLASFSSQTLPSFSPVLSTVLIHICFLLLSAQSELKLHVQRLSTFSYEVSFDMDLWNYLSPSECPIQCFHLWILTFLTYMARWEYQQCSLAVFQNWRNFEVFTKNKPISYVSKKCKFLWMYLQHKKYEKCS